MKAIKQLLLTSVFFCAAIPAASSSVPGTCGGAPGASKLHVFSPPLPRDAKAEEDLACPAGFPLDCGNGKCCPAGATLYCPQMEPTPCFNPDDLTDEQLKILENNCSPLLSCR